MDLQTRDYAQHFIHALNALERHGDSSLETMVQLFSPMAQITNALLRRSHHERTGQVGAREFWKEYRRSFREVHTEFSDITCGERAAGLFWTSRGTSLMGLPFEYDGATLLVFDDDGQIVLFRGYYDSRDLEMHMPRSPRMVSEQLRPGTTPS